MAFLKDIDPINLSSDIQLVSTSNPSDTLDESPQKRATFITPTEDVKLKYHSNTQTELNSVGITISSMPANLFSDSNDDDYYEQLLLKLSRFGIMPPPKDVTQLRRYIYRKKNEMIIERKFERSQALDRLATKLGPGELETPEYIRSIRPSTSMPIRSSLRVRITPTSHGSRHGGVILKPIGQVHNCTIPRNSVSSLSRRKTFM